MYFLWICGFVLKAKMNWLSVGKVSENERSFWIFVCADQPYKWKEKNRYKEGRGGRKKNEKLFHYSANGNPVFPHSWDESLAAVPRRHHITYPHHESNTSKPIQNKNNICIISHFIYLPKKDLQEGKSIKKNTRRPEKLAPGKRTPASI